MSEQKPTPTVDYRNPDLPAWPPRIRSPLGLVVSYAAGCGIGFCGGVIVAAVATVHRGARDSIGSMALCFGFVTFATFVTMLVMTLLAVSLRTYLLGARPTVLARPAYSFLSGLVVGMVGGAVLFFLSDPDRHSKLLIRLMWTVAPTAAAAGGAVGLVRPAPGCSKGISLGL